MEEIVKNKWTIGEKLMMAYFIALVIGAGIIVILSF
jgi:cell division protein FtsL